MIRILDIACNSYRHLVLLSMKLSSSLFLREMELDFTSQPLTQSMFQTDSLMADRLEEETEDESSNSSDLTWLERLRQDAS